MVSADLFSLHFLKAYAVWLAGPWLFFGPVVAVQHFLFERDPDVWARGSLPERDWVTLFLDHLCIWAVAYSFAWVVLCAINSVTHWKFNKDFPSAGFAAVEALRCVGGVAVLTTYHWLIIEGAYSGSVPGIIVPNTAEEALAAMPSYAEVVFPWGLIVAAYGDLHFYITHRILHAFPALYNAIHKVHHRSVNTNPFSGMSMHPLEHLVYASQIVFAPLVGVACGGMPAWVVRAIAMGLILYPIPGHIGTSPFEKMHWDHHTKFNWNFGSSPMFDLLLETDYDTYVRNTASKQQVRGHSVAAEGAARQAAAVGAKLPAP